MPKMLLSTALTHCQIIKHALFLLQLVSDLQSLIKSAEKTEWKGEGQKGMLTKEMAA